MPKIFCTVTNDLTYDQRMQRICRSLTLAGYEVTLIGRLRPSSSPLEPEPYHQERIFCRYESGIRFYMEYNFRLLRYLLSHPFDLVCAVDLDTILPAFTASRLKNRLCVYDAHEYFTEVPEVERRPLIKAIWKTIGRLTIPHLKYAYTVGPALAGELARDYGIPFAVIRNVPEPQPVPPEEKHPEKPVILYQGALNEGRGLEQAISAMVSLPKAQLWLAGEGDLSKPLRELTRQLGLEERVRFLGFVRPKKLKSLTPRAAIGLNLLESRGLSYYFSLANKAFDYIQAGVPSIHMNFPEYRRINEQHRVFHLLTELSPTAVAAAIRRLLSDDNYYQLLRNNCLIARDNYTWEREEKVLLDFYRHILPPN